jgi:hypothetical protein
MKPMMALQSGAHVLAVLESVQFNDPAASYP